MALLPVLWMEELPQGLGERGFGDLLDTDDRDGLRVGVVRELLTVPGGKRRESFPRSF